MRTCTSWMRLLCTVAAIAGLCQTAKAQTGACCTTAGVCTLTLASACNGTSVWLGVGATSCTPTNSCQGACCTGTGACSVNTLANCGGANTFIGLGTTCTVNPCTARLGACCTVLGICNAGRTPANCTGTDVFQGFGSSCSPSPCVATAGPCCAGNGACTLTVPTACALPSTFGAVGSSCSPNPCTPIPMGGCCTNTGVCVVKPAQGSGAAAACGGVVSVSSLSGAAGTVTGTTGVAHNFVSGMTVTIGGATPTGYNGTVVITVTSATQFTYSNATTGASTGTITATAVGETYLGNGTACAGTPCASLTGACCSTAGVCNQRTIAGCAATANQTFLGVGVSCSPAPCVTGACCSHLGVCSLTIASACGLVTTNFGTSTYLGNGTTCTPSTVCTTQLGAGACCPNGTGACAITIPSGCIAASFATFNGVGTTCSPDPCAAQRGACCANAGTCTSTTALGCFGTFIGAGTSCTAAASPCQAITGACCNAVGGCTMSIGTGCTGVNSFRGAGTVCFPDPCAATTAACCSAIGACTITTAGGCVGANTFGAPGSTCGPSPCPALLATCCTSLGGCSITTAAGCAGFGVHGAAASCSPNPCTATTGRCCNSSNNTCTVTTALACLFTWTSGQACNPGNPCAASLGACCIGLGCSVDTDPTFCNSVGGVSFANNVCSPSPCVRPLVVISQIFTGGGNSGAVFNYDYVELFNRGSTDVVMNNWSIQFGAQSTQTFPSRAIFSGTIQAGKYFLIRLATADPAIGAPLSVAPDWIATESVNLDLSAGRVALVSNSNPLSNGCPAPLPVNIVDFVGYGTPSGNNAPTCSEGGSPAGGQGGAFYAYYRKANGCQDTDNNGFDFLQPLLGNPRNSASTGYTCGSTTSGACCAGEVCTLVADASTCPSAPAGFAGEGTVCTPNPCVVPRGACCTGTSCTLQVQGGCPAPFNFSFGRTCIPDPCTGACCNGAVCTVGDITTCTGSAFFIAGTTCGFNPCPTPVAVQNGDIIYGASVAQNQDAVQQIRGTGAANPMRVGTWTKYNNLQVMRLDNHNGVLHNAEGNLLGLDFGSQSAGGAIFNLPTTTGNASAGSPVFQFTGANSPFGIQRARFAGLSVSPNNDRIACIGYDAARLYVMSYNPGPSIGTGSGAFIDGAAQTDNTTFVFGFNITQGTTWLDNDNLLMWVQSEVASVIKLYRVPVSGSGAGISIGTPVAVLEVFDNKPNSSRFTSVAYNPQLVPGYIFAGSSAFSGVTLNSMYVIKVTGSGAGATFSLLHSVNLGTSLQTEREIAIGPDRNLYLSQFAGTGTLAGDSIIDRILLDANADGVVTDAEVLAIADNSSTNFYFKGSANTSSFNALDIAVSLGACCTGTTCTLQPPNFCTGAVGTYQGNNTICTPNPCAPPGVCCRGATCSSSAALQSQAACAASLTGGAQAGAKFVPAAVCGGANHAVPCCYADYNQDGTRGVGDIFNFLADWFAGRGFAATGGDGTGTPGVPNIFTFLTDWFAGNCP